MKSISVPDDYRKIDESPNMIVYEVKTVDRFMGFICRRYDVKLCLCVERHRINGYMCMRHIDNRIRHRLFSSGVVSLGDKKMQLVTPYVDFSNVRGSFQSNIDEWVDSLKLKIIDAIGRGLNILVVCGEEGDLGVIPRGSSENEIMMKMELMGV